jgi:hypothetical protein
MRHADKGRLAAALARMVFDPSGFKARQLATGSTFAKDWDRLRAAAGAEGSETLGELEKSFYDLLGGNLPFQQPTLHPAASPDGIRALFESIKPPDETQ